MNRKKAVLWGLFAVFGVFLAVFIATRLIWIPASPSASSNVPIFYKIDKEKSLLFLFDSGQKPIQEIAFDENGPLSGPIRRLALFSSTYFPMLDALDAVNRLSAVDRARYCNTPSVVQKIKEGTVIEVGELPNPNFERLLSCRVDSLFAPAFSVSPAFEKRCREAGIRIFYFQEWLEANPLSRASWIQVMGILLGRQTQADTVYRTLEQNYRTVLRSRSDRPLSDPVRVLTATPYNGVWYLPGGNSYLARLIHDAGGTLIGPANTETGSVAHAPERVLVWGASADLWLVNTTPAETAATLRKSLPLCPDLAAFQTGQLYNNTKRVNPYGGNDYYESSVLHPDWILSDLIELLNAANEKRAADETRLRFFTQIH